jgi:hypothetical protein
MTVRCSFDVLLVTPKQQTTKTVSLHPAAELVEALLHKKAIP